MFFSFSQTFEKHLYLVEQKLKFLSIERRVPDNQGLFWAPALSKFNVCTKCKKCTFQPQFWSTSKRYFQEPDCEFHSSNTMFSFPKFHHAQKHANPEPTLGAHHTTHPNIKK
jgi:hypothetical protein